MTQAGFTAAAEVATVGGLPATVYMRVKPVPNKTIRDGYEFLVMIGVREKAPRYLMGIADLIQFFEFSRAYLVQLPDLDVRVPEPESLWTVESHLDTISTRLSEQKDIFKNIAANFVVLIKNLGRG